MPYSYSSNFANPAGANSWQYKTVETLPDGNQNIVYADNLGDVMLKVFVDVNDPGNPSLVGQTSETITGRFTTTSAAPSRRSMTTAGRPT